MKYDFHQIEKAICYMLKSSDGNPTVDEIAANVDSNPQHLLKIFEEWADVSPEKFHQYLNERYIKSQLKSELNLFDGGSEFLNSKSVNLHSDLVEIDVLSQEELNLGLNIFYSRGKTPYGDVLMASTKKGVCSVNFLVDSTSEKSKLKKKFQNANLVKEECEFHNQVLRVFYGEEIEKGGLRLHLKGSPFQLKVWNALLEIPYGELVTYGSLAKKIGNPKAYRAVGAAVGQNPIAYIIPCQRVVAKTGVVGNFRWGSVRKAAMIGREAVENKKTRPL